jgi:hypothetical protein
MEHILCWPLGMVMRIIQLSLVSLVLSCGHQCETTTSAPRRSRVHHSFNVECSFGISGCESLASDRCGYAGFHVLGSYRTQGAFGTPYFYMKAACGPAPVVADTPMAAPASPVLSPGPSPVSERRESGPYPVLEVECRFGISGCESQASKQCGYAGYHVLGSYRTQGAFGTPYFYMRAACGPAPNAPPPSPPDAR